MKRTSKKIIYRLGFFCIVVGVFLLVSGDVVGKGEENSTVPQGITITKVGEWDGSGYYEAVFIKGNYAYCAAGSSGLDIIDISDPSHPIKVVNYNTPGYAQGVYVDGNYAFVADIDSLEVLDVSDPTNPHLADSLSTGGFPLGVYVSGDYAYLANAWEGLYIVQLKSLPSVYGVGIFDTSYYARNVHVDGNYAYVADDLGGLQIIDVSVPGKPTYAGGIGKNIYVDHVYVTGGYAYLSCWYEGVKIVDVSDPTTPTLVGSSSSYYGYKIKVRNHYAYVAVGPEGLGVLDVSNPSVPTWVGKVNTPGLAWGVDVNGSYAYVADDYAGLQVIDISKPSQPTTAGSYDNSYRFTDIAVSGDYIYLTDDSSGLHIFDKSNPADISPLGNYGPLQFTEGIKIKGKYAYMTGVDGLYIMDVSNPSHPTLVGKYKHEYMAMRLDVVGRYAYVGNGPGLMVIDISAPSNPTLVGNFQMSDTCRDVSVNNGYAYIAGQSLGLLVVDVSTPSNPTLAGEYDTGNALRVYASGNYVLVTDSVSDVNILDVSDPSNPVPVGSYKSPAFFYGVYGSGNYAFVTAEQQLLVLDISVPSEPLLVGSYNFDASIGMVYVDDEYIYAAGFDGKFYILSFTALIPPQIGLDRNALIFGADTSGNISPSQSFLISNNGGGTLNWTMSAAESWLQFSPVSGTGSRSITVSVDAAGLSAGTYTGSITIQAPAASNSPQSLAVTLNVVTPSQTREPFGVFATPADSSTVRSSVPFTGWVLDDIGVESVKLYREDGPSLVYIGDAVFVEGARPDVEAAYPGYPFNYRAGWGYMMLANFLPYGDGAYTIHAIAVDVEGKQVTLGARKIWVDNASAVKPFGAIDTPGQGGIASGINFRNQGWVLTPLPNTIPTDGSTIRVLVDGIDLGNPTYNIYREDIATLFPGYSNSDGALAYLDIDLTAFSNGVHTMSWFVKDDAGNADGIGSRYFSIENSDNGVQSLSNKIGGRGSFLCPPGDFSGTPIDYIEPIKVKKGYSENIEFQPGYPDDSGLITIETTELQRLEIQLFPGRTQPIGSPSHGAHLRSSHLTGCTGFLVVGGQLRPLPIGSFLDKETGTFFWQLGPGFVGNYQLVFFLNREYKRIIDIKINPRW